MITRRARAARGASIAAFAAFTAALAHAAGGGHAPGPLAVVLALAASTPLAMVLVGVRARLLGTSVAAVATQAALHLCFAIGAGAAAAPGASSVGAVGAQAHARHAGAAGVAVHPIGFDVVAIDHGHAAMPFTHLAAAALTVVAILLADRSAGAIARTVRMLLGRLVAVRTPLARPVGRVLLRADRRVRVLRSAILAAARPVRGPPVLVSVAP
ncbi:hypothetical protein ACDF64_02210 [Agromyces sp. MMS24-JH15]|uniref:hypothetical protein n=1 Tax=Agromyces sp. MMS24-JH15 TaxID=3243765 RepID=UPI00374A8219